MFKINTKDTKTTQKHQNEAEICSKLTIKTEWRQWRHSGVFIVNFEQISHLLVHILLTLNMWLPAGKLNIKLYFFLWEINIYVAYRDWEE